MDDKTKEMYEEKINYLFEVNEMYKKTQIIKCKCGKVFAACHEPYCYDDRDWLNSLKKYVKKGFEIDLVESGCFKFEKCECKENGNKI